MLTNLAVCHTEAYRLIHSYRQAMGWSGTRVSVSLRAHDFVPRGTGQLAQRAAELVRRSFFYAPLRAFAFGRSVLPMKYHRLLALGVYVDFLAIDWHGRAAVSTLRDALPCRTDAVGECELGALLPFLASARAALPLPLSVTLCGVEDGVRTAYLAKALRLLHGSTLPVSRCFYQGFTDGFEWLNGHSSRRGAVHVDFETQERTVKPEIGQLLL